MQEGYQKAIACARTIVAEAFINDIEGILELGTRLDNVMQDAVRELGRQALTQIYNALDAVLIQRYQAPGWKIKAHPVIQFTTILGEVSVHSAYLWHQEHSPGIRPLKDCMGVEGNRSREAVHRAMVDFGSEKSFERASRQFQEHSGWAVGRGTMLNQTERVAREAEQYIADRLQQGAHPASAPQSLAPVSTMVVEVDGCEIRTGRPMTAADAGRRDLPPMQGVRVEEWKDIRTGLVRPLGEEERVYISRMASYPEVCAQLVDAARGRGLTLETHVIAPGDGGQGLKEELAKHFLKFQYILDYRHLSSHFYATADALGVASDRRKAWVTGYMDMLWENQVRGVVKQLNALYRTTHNDRLRQLLKHLHRFRDAVDYGRFDDNGWPVGSGEIESAHRYIPQERLKIAGACWHPETVNPMLALRVLRANGWWNDFWTWRHEQRPPKKQELRAMSKGN